MNKKELITNLEELPKKICDLRKQILEKEEVLELLKNTYEEIELKEMEVIESVIGTDNKKVYSNENKRKIELMIRLKENVGYQEIITEHTLLNKNTKRMIIELGLKQDTLKSLRSIVILWNEEE